MSQKHPLKMCLLLILLCSPIMMGNSAYHKATYRGEDEKQEELDISFRYQKPSEGIWGAMSYYGIPDSIQTIVYAQAVLESGVGTRTKKNNLFGITYNGRVHHFRHWWQSVEAYHKHFYSKYEQGQYKDYYYFLQHIPPNNKPYAEDPHYIKKLKKIVRTLD